MNLIVNSVFQRKIIDVTFTISHGTLLSRATPCCDCQLERLPYYVGIVTLHTQLLKHIIIITKLCQPLNIKQVLFGTHGTGALPVVYILILNACYPL